MHVDMHTRHVDGGEGWEEVVCAAGFASCIIALLVCQPAQQVDATSFIDLSSRICCGHCLLLAASGPFHHG